MGYVCLEWIYDDGLYNFEVFLLKDLFKLCYLRIVIIKYEFFIVIYDVYYSSRLGMSCLVNIVFCREFKNGSYFLLNMVYGGLWK